jgi:hypothetical protein
MNRTLDGVIYWLPRALGILFAVFLSVFALDVFQQGYNAVHVALALVIHLLPAAAIVVLLALAWRWEGPGGAAFIVLALLYLFTASGQYKWTAYAVISGPLLVIGVFFMIGWWRTRKPVR